MGFPKQIKTISATKVQTTDLPGGVRGSYECANPFILKGLTGQPHGYQQCIAESLYGSVVLDIVNKLGDFNPWDGPNPAGNATTESVYTDIRSPETVSVEDLLGSEYTGCYWPAPDSAFSCNCPGIGEKYLDYLKLRLNVATFWNTRPEAPILRKKFLDSINYGQKVTFTIAGDFTIRPGSIVELYADAISGYSTSIVNSFLNKKYYVISVKNTVTNSGVHETTIVGVEPVL